MYNTINKWKVIVRNDKNNKIQGSLYYKIIYFIYVDFIIFQHLKTNTRHNKKFISNNKKLANKISILQIKYFWNKYVLSDFFVILINIKI